MSRPLMYHMARALRDEWLKPRELDILQLKKLRHIVRYAYRLVPYYHELFDAHGFGPDDIRSTRDLTRIPLLTKNGVKENLQRLLAQGTDTTRAVWLRTGGTTSSPISVAKDAERWRINHALQMRKRLAFLEKPWDKAMVVAHPVHASKTRLHQQGLGIFRHMHTAFFRTVPLERIGETPRVMRSIADFRPKVLTSHEFILRLLSHYLDLLPEDRRPRVIHTAGEVQDKTTRRMLEDAFGCGVYFTYGSAEFGNTGFECREQRGYHAHSDHILIEYLRDGEQVESDELGEMVVTDLTNQAMPLIRYRLGDVGIPSCEPCPCGRGLPLLSSVDGRIDDLVLLPNGQILTPRQITSQLNAIRGMAIYRFTQRSLDVVVVEYVRSRLHTESTQEEILKRCRDMMPKSVEVRVREVLQDIIPHSLGPVVSKVSRASVNTLGNLSLDVPRVALSQVDS